MREIPILFRDDMVREILAGRKTVTRRVGKTWARARPGDRLWGREAWNVGEWVGGEGARSWFEPLHIIPAERPSVADIETIYREEGFPALADVPPYRPSIHMPRWACRLELDVVSVEAIEESPRIQAAARPGDDLSAETAAIRVGVRDAAEAAREGFDSVAAFGRAWLAMHGDAHPWPVYRIEFRRVSRG